MDHKGFTDLPRTFRPKKRIGRIGERSADRPRLARRLLRSHGGNLTEMSAAGGGALFLVALPVGKEQTHDSCRALGR
jgi:hypothetical protein